jgi:hypothetical protein
MENKRKYIRWNSPKAVNTVKKHVKQSPEDLKGALQKAAEELDTTFTAVLQAWHGKIKFNTRGFAKKRVKAAKISTTTVQTTEVEEAVESAPVAVAKTTRKPIYETVVSTQEIEGMRVVTVRQYYLA